MKPSKTTFSLEDFDEAMEYLQTEGKITPPRIACGIGFLKAAYAHNPAGFSDFVNYAIITTTEEGLSFIEEMTNPNTI